MEFMELLGPAITTILLNILIAVLSAVGVFVVNFVRSKLNANQLELLESIAANVVLAVEQSTYGTELAENAAAKKSAAITMLNSFTKKYGISLTEAQIDAAIEAAVANVINANKLIEPAKMVELEGPQDHGFIG